MIRFHDSVKPLLVDAGRLTPHQQNPNNGDVEEIVTSVQVNGCYRPVYAAPDGRIIAGHHLYAALLELGATQVPVLFLDEGAEVAYKRIMVGDNEIARRARNDPGVLLEVLKEIRVESEHGLAGTGVDDYDMLRLLDEINEPSTGFGGGTTTPSATIHVEVPLDVHEEWLTRLAEHDGSGVALLRDLLGLDD